MSVIIYLFAVIGAVVVFSVVAALLVMAVAYVAGEIGMLGELDKDYEDE